MAYDAVKMQDWQISEEAEKNMPTPEEWREKLGLEKEEMLPMGRLAKLDFLKIIERLKDKPDGKYIEVTAITPTPLGEGKSTTSCGLMEGLGKRGVNVGGALRQPSGGPTMNIKGTAAGGGNSLLIPMTEFSLGLTGDINDIMNAHNLAMVAMTARMQHERNYNDEQLQRLTRMRRLDIDPTRVEIGLDHGLLRAGPAKYHHRHRRTVGRIHHAVQVRHCREFRIDGHSVDDPGSGRPERTLGQYHRGLRQERQTGHHGRSRSGRRHDRLYAKHHQSDPDVHRRVQPCMVHAGPFANIAVGQSSIIADRVGLKLFDYHVTEVGFAADIGFEKFWNVKCRFSGLKPHVSVLTTTIRALKMHGGGPRVVAGNRAARGVHQGESGLVEKGIENMVHISA